MSKNIIGSSKNVEIFVSKFTRVLEHSVSFVIVISLLAVLPIKIFFGDKVKILPLIFSKTMKALFVPFKLFFTYLVTPILKAFCSAIVNIFNFIFKEKNSQEKKGATFLNPKEVRQIMNLSEKGLLIDGTEKRISKDLSFTHLLLVSSTGGGKTSKYIIPNVITLAGDREPCSMVITDPSGEIYEKTSAYLHQKGFTLHVLNPAQPQKSLGYNPLAKVETVTDIGEIAHILVNSANPNAKDPFWGQGAETIIEIFIHCLKSLNQAEFLNLHNVLYLLQNFGNRQALDNFVSTNANQTVFNQYKGFIGGNPNTTASFISTATTSLKMFSNTDICQMMSKDEVNFENMRKKKTALFLIVPSEKMSYYSFFLNIFYTQFFQAMMKSLPNKKSLPVYALMDEFANIGTIPNFTTILTTIRKYHVSLSIVLQDLSQLSVRYGREEMTTILGNTASKLCYGGVDMNTAQYFENMIGKVYKEEKDKKSGHISYREHNLIDAQQIRTMSKDQALFLVSNKNPILLEKVLPYFQNPKFKRRVQLKPHEFQRQTNFSNIHYVGI